MSHMSTQYVNQSIAVTIYLDNFPICQEANGVFKESTCADNMKLCTAENRTSSYQTKGHM
jgi:hypothetical protein